MTEPPEWEVGQPRRQWVPLVLLVAAALAGGALLRIDGGVAPQPPGLSIEEVSPPPVLPQGRPAAVEPLVPGRWDAIAVAPIEGRLGAAMVWTGGEVLVWGGLGDELHGDGALYARASGTWRTVAPSPLRRRVHAGAAWTGQEAVILGGFSGKPGHRTRIRPSRNGAAYDPAEDSWRRLPPLPFTTASGRVFAVDGRLYAVSLAAHPRPVAVLDAGSATWRLIAEPPGWRADGDFSVTRTHAGVLLWPGSRGDAVALDVARERWTELRQINQPLASGNCDCLLHGGPMAGGGVEAIGYDAARREWWRADGTGGASQLVESNAHLYLFSQPGTPTAIDRATGAMLDVSQAPEGLAWQPNAVWMETQLFVWSGVRSLRGVSTSDGLIFTPRPVPTK